MKRKVPVLAMVTIFMVVLTGCWNYREIDKFAIVAGVAIDKAGPGKYLLTVEIVNVKESAQGGSQTSSVLLETEGDTLFDAIRNAIKKSARRLYWGHAEVIVLSQEVAKDGILSVLDMMDRDAEPRLTVDLLVSRENTAKEILALKTMTEEIRSYEINNTLSSQESLAKTPEVEVYQFVNALSEEGLSPVMPAIQTAESAGSQTFELYGTAVFSADKLVGFLDEQETRNFLYVMDAVKGGIISVQEPSSHETSESKDGNISLEVYRNITKVRPEVKNGNLRMNIDIQTETTVSEYGTTYNLLTEQGMRILKKDAEELIKSDVESIVRKMQKEYDLDIFGFGNDIRRDMPEVWKRIRPNWAEMFKHLEVNVNVKINIKNTGLLLKPIEMGD